MDLKKVKECYLFVLRIVDDEDDFHYTTLIFDNVDDYNLAQNVIKQYEKEFYEQEEFEMENWYEGLMEKLKEADLLGLKIEADSIIYVR